MNRTPDMIRDQIIRGMIRSNPISSTFIPRWRPEYLN